MVGENRGYEGEEVVNLILLSQETNNMSRTILLDALKIRTNKTQRNSKTEMQLRERYR